MGPPPLLRGSRDTGEVSLDPEQGRGAGEGETLRATQASLQLLILRLNKYSFFFSTLGWKLSNDKHVRQVKIKIPVLFLIKPDQRCI